VQRMSVHVEKVVRFEETDRVRMDAARRVLNTYLDSRFDGSPHDLIVDGAGLTDEIGALYVAREGPGGLWLSAQAEPNEGVAPEQLAKGFDDFLRARASDGVPPPIVERIKKRLIEEHALTMKDPEAYARELTQWLGQRRSYSEFASYSADLASVTSDDVDALLRAIAAPGREIVGILSPAG
jgi:predicted Zn-dependent peptidase